MEKEGGNRERMRKCRESISLHILIFSPFPPHFLILSPFPLLFLFISSFSLHFLAARLQGCNDSCSPDSENIWFSWSKSSNYRGKLRCHARDGRTHRGRRKVENRAVFCQTRNRNFHICLRSGPRWLRPLPPLTVSLTVKYLFFLTPRLIDENHIFNLINTSIIRSVYSKHENVLIDILGSGHPSLAAIRFLTKTLWEWGLPRLIFLLQKS